MLAWLLIWWYPVSYVNKVALLSEYKRSEIPFINRASMWATKMVLIAPKTVSCAQTVLGIRTYYVWTILNTIIQLFNINKLQWGYKSPITALHGITALFQVLPLHPRGVQRSRIKSLVRDSFKRQYQMPPFRVLRYFCLAIYPQHLIISSLNELKETKNYSYRSGVVMHFRSMYHLLRT